MNKHFLDAKKGMAYVLHTVKWFGSYIDFLPAHPRQLIEYCRSLLLDFLQPYKQQKFGVYKTTLCVSSKSKHPVW